MFPQFCFQSHSIGFYQAHKINNIGIRGLTMWNKIFHQQNVTSDEDWTWDFWFQVWHSIFWANLALACKSETFQSLYSHALLILDESSKPKNWGSGWTDDSFKIPSVAHVRLAQKESVQTWNQMSQVQSSL